MRRDPPPRWNWLRAFQAPPEAVVEKVADEPPRPPASPPTWDSTSYWRRSLRSFEQHALHRLERELRQWDELLAKLGGDCSRVDLSQLRTLRLSREEDWSDWLTTLLATSKTHALGSLLVGISEAARVHREVTIEDGARRADIVLDSGVQAAHIEVKVGDDAFEKTLETCHGVEGRFGLRSWSHWILLPETAVETWLSHAPSISSGIAIKDLTWSQVAVALRKCRLQGVEAMPWQCWAWTFCGAIEQKIIGIPSSTEATRDDLRHAAPAWLSLLQRERKSE